MTSKPSITFSNIIFSDKTKITLSPTDIVVLVGPNNSGKSVALKELEAFIKDSTINRVVVHNAELHRTGNEHELLKYVRLNKQTQSRYRTTERSEQNVQTQVKSDWNNSNGISKLAPIFCMSLSTESRIIGSNPANAYPALDDPPSNPIQMLYSEDSLEEKISDYFRQAFGEDLIVYQRGGSKIPLLVGNRPPLEHEEKSNSTTYSKKLKNLTKELQNQGDGMRSFASIILHLLTSTTLSVLFLDEPEVFLHPPQAKLIGELIAKKRPPNTQLFISTHSPDVLKGLLNAMPNNLHILRINRRGSINEIKELDRQQKQNFNTDPLMKYSSVMSGIFHKRVIICESDSDCMFYNILLNLREVHGGQQPDVLFIHGNGKGQVSKLAKALVSFGVSVDLIADIDVLKDESILKKMIETLGGKWSDIQQSVQQVFQSIEQNTRKLKIDEIKEKILKILDSLPMQEPLPKDKFEAITAILRSSSPWKSIKNAGESAIPNGDATKEFRKIMNFCKKIGIWIVPVGELEGFCKSVSGHGPKWVQNVIENLNLEEAPELKSARDFVKEIWTSRNNTES